MAARSPSAGAPSRSPAVERGSERLQRSGQRLGRGLSLPAGIVLLLLKAHVLTALLHHRAGVIAFLGLSLAASVLRSRPVAIALCAGPLLAFALAPRPTELGIALGVGSAVLLLVAFIAIGTVLQARSLKRSP